MNKPLSELFNRTYFCMPRSQTLGGHTLVLLAANTRRRVSFTGLLTLDPDLSNLLESVESRMTGIFFAIWGLLHAEG